MEKAGHGSSFPEAGEVSTGQKGPEDFLEVVGH